ncbi:Biofilm growth-associated repressor [Kingella potus]|uniref:Biofilm growth-associated repressor n=1 Tax=Kingella potus TaxID=265175 RepID=A0A377R2T3_9NEIS|nr:metalloregulator ArsR/SmtB family transcription factor [Kingella potus]UOP01819.1 metalloregulator ArsR/SmtB family transcription factor [Kingella potus]STR03087.1 Biofilm growth-associated repressor [Kingella potus]
MNTNLQRLNPARGGNGPMRNAEHVAAMLKLMAHPSRLMLLCLLSEGPCNVSDMAHALGISQTALSNHLAKLREGKLIDFTRYHRVLEYHIASSEAQTILEVLSGFCLNRSPAAPDAAQCPLAAANGKSGGTTRRSKTDKP